jgi:hypothetical protein
VVVNADIRAMTKLWLGYMGLNEAMRGDALRIDGERWARGLLIDLLELENDAAPKSFTFAAPPPMVDALRSNAA